MKTNESQTYIVVYGINLTTQIKQVVSGQARICLVWFYFIAEHLVVVLLVFLFVCVFADIDSLVLEISKS